MIFLRNNDDTAQTTRSKGKEGVACKKVNSIFEYDQASKILHLSFL